MTFFSHIKRKLSSALCPFRATLRYALRVILVQLLETRSTTTIHHFINKINAYIPHINVMSLIQTKEAYNILRRSRGW